MKYLPVLMMYVAVHYLKYLPMGHGGHEVALVAPVTSLNVPTRQGVNPTPQVPVSCAEQ